jgi:Uma2 family endonuclease
MPRLIERVVPSVPQTRRSLPPLQNGDNLTLAEFEERFDAMPGPVRAELIEGVVFVPPVLQEGHSGPQFDFVGLLSIYRFATPGVVGGDNGSVQLGGKSLPQPDAFLMIAPGLGGSAVIGPKGYVVGSPEFVAEIANTSADYDLHQKLDVYQRNGVREYAVWRTFDGDFDYFVLTDGTYQRAVPDAQGIVRSSVLPGLWLNIPRLLAGDFTAVVADIQRGTASPEHAAFVAELRRRRETANP